MNKLSHFELERAVEQATPALPFVWTRHAGGFARRRWRGVLLACGLCAIAGFAATTQMAPSFTAATTLLLDKRRSESFLQTHTAVDTQSLNAQIESQVEVLRSAGLARAVAERLNLAGTRPGIPSGAALIAHQPTPLRQALIDLGLMQTATQAVSDAGTAEANAAEALQRMTAVRRVGLTYVVEISVSAETAQAAARLANAITEAYVAEQLAARSQAAQEANRWLSARIVELSEQARDADQAVQVYKKSRNIVATDEGLINEQQLTAVTARLATLRAATDTARAQLERARLMLRGGDANGGISGSVMGDGLQSTILDTLRQKYIDRQRQYVEWSARFGSGHEAVRRLQSEINELQAGIKGELQRIVSTATNSFEIARANEAATGAQVDEITSQSARVNEDRVQLRALQSKADTFRTLYASFLQHYTQAAQDQSFPGSEVQVISQAVPPSARTGPKTALITGGSAVAGLALGLLAGLLAEVSGSSSARQSGRARCARGLPCLGTVPRLQPHRTLNDGFARLRQIVLGGPRQAALELPRETEAMLRLCVDHPDEPFGTAIASITREVLDRVISGRDGRVIGCLAMSAGEGTSTTAANLAHALALAGHRTLLIDMSDGPSTLSRLMRRPTSAGHSAIGMPEPAARLHQDRRSGLLFRPAPALSGASDQLVEPPTRASMDALRRTHDFIILDLPPIQHRQPAHDALALVDDMLMVARWMPQDEDILMDAPDLAAASLRCLGIVLTMVPPARCELV